MAKVLIGYVQSGIGSGRTHVADKAGEFLKAHFGMDVYPGTLGLKFKEPFYLSANALTAGDRRFALVKLNGTSVVLKKGLNRKEYKGQIYASVHLRSALGLSDGDEIRLEIDERHFQSIGLRGRLSRMIRLTKRSRPFVPLYRMLHLLKYGRSVASSSRARR
jgi:hypothetical protein